MIKNKTNTLMSCICVRNAECKKNFLTCLISNDMIDLTVGNFVISKISVRKDHLCQKVVLVKKSHTLHFGSQATFFRFLKTLKRTSE